MEDESDNRNREPEALPGPVLFHNEVVIDHFMNPRNVGALPEAEADGFGLVGDPSCGDQMKLSIAVNDGRIARIAFKSFGCPGAIATSSMLTALASVMTGGARGADPRREPLRAVLGGFHLNEASEARLARTTIELQELDPDLIVPCHCTGDAAVEALRQSFGEHVLPGSAGAVFRLGGASASTTKEQT